MPHGRRSTPGGALRGTSRQGGFGVSSGGPAVYSSAPRQYYNYESPPPTKIPSYNENYEPPGFSDIYDKAVEAQQELARMHGDPNTLVPSYMEAVTNYLNILKHGVDMCKADTKAKESSACKTHKKFYTTTSATYKQFNTNADARQFNINADARQFNTKADARVQGGRRSTRKGRKARSTRMRKSRRV